MLVFGLNSCFLIGNMFQATSHIWSHLKLDGHHHVVLILLLGFHLKMLTTPMSMRKWTEQAWNQPVRYYVNASVAPKFGDARVKCRHWARPKRLSSVTLPSKWKSTTKAKLNYFLTCLCQLGKYIMSIHWGTKREAVDSLQPMEVSLAGPGSPWVNTGAGQTEAFNYHNIPSYLLAPSLTQQS